MFAECAYAGYNDRLDDIKLIVNVRATPGGDDAEQGGPMLSNKRVALVRLDQPQI